MALQEGETLLTCSGFSCSNLDTCLIFLFFYFCGKGIILILQVTG